MFKVPTLRNVTLTAPYFHSGRAWILEEALDVMAWTQLGKRLGREQVASLKAFMRSLTGTVPIIDLPALPSSTEKTPHPVY